MAFDPLSSQGMMTSLEMGYCIGSVLAARIRRKTEDSVESGIEEVYRRVREEYQHNRAYYYSLAKRRFKGESFWDNA